MTTKTKRIRVPSSTVSLTPISKASLREITLKNNEPYARIVEAALALFESLPPERRAAMIGSVRSSL